MLFFIVIGLNAAEVKNLKAYQQGGRAVFEYDLEGDSAEGVDITIEVNINGKTYTQDDLSLEGDIKKVKPGKNKKVYWNVLKDFPKGLVADNILLTLVVGGCKNGKECKDPITGMEFVYVPGGCFQMGDTFGDGESDEEPVHEVCVDGFYMGKYEVTQGQWEKVMGNNPSYFKSCGDDCPVERVSWNDVQNFINKLKRQTGKNYRLPTEAEWEYACRSGGKKEKYCGGDNIDAVAWYYDNSGGKTHPVGQKQPNGLGIYDMSGNVYEWVQDWYDSSYYRSSPKNNPTGPSSGSSRVKRGGSWLNLPRLVRASYRNYGTPGSRDNYIGFRLVVEDN
ncbi:formylglycine-generating enzyme family protein [Deferribacter thermophilus]